MNGSTMSADTIESQSNIVETSNGIPEMVPIVETVNDRKEEKTVNKNVRGMDLHVLLEEDYVKKAIGEILNIPVTSDWNIVSSIPSQSLYMVHYSENADMTKFGHLRGVVLDVHAKCVVCASYGYAPTITTDHLQITKDGCFEWKDDESGQMYKIEPSQVSFKMGFEGAIVRVFKHNGIVYYATHRRLDITNSHWGQSMNFRDMFKQLGGPIENALFSNEAQCSPICHTFLMVHPDLLVASKQDFSSIRNFPSGEKMVSGYLVYLGYNEMYSTDPTECPYRQTNLEGKEMVVEPCARLVEMSGGKVYGWHGRPMAGYFPNEICVPKTCSTFPLLPDAIYGPDFLNLDLAQRHLQFGFATDTEVLMQYAPDFLKAIHQDVRLTSGEFVMAYVNSPNPSIPRLIKIQSRAYAWRNQMHNGDPNRYHQFYHLMDMARLSVDKVATARAEFESFFPIVPPILENDLKSISQETGFRLFPLIHSMNVGGSSFYSKQRSLSTWYDRAVNIWASFLMSLPLTVQKEASLYLEKYLEDRKVVVDFLSKLACSSYDESKLSLRAKQLMGESVKRAQSTNMLPKVKVTSDKQGKLNTQNSKYPKNKNMAVRQNMTYFIGLETGHSLYRLRREVKHYQQKMAVGQQPI